MEGVTRHVLANAHSKDLQTQGKYGVRFITYWFDEVRSTAFCLVDAPNKEAIQRAHDEAHGDVPSEIIEVDPAVVEAFLGRVTDPPPIKGGEPAPLDAGARAIMFTDLQDSTAMTRRLGDAKAMHLLRVHNVLTRNALREHAGREIKHLGDGIYGLICLHRTCSRRRHRDSKGVCLLQCSECNDPVALAHRPERG